MNNQQKLSEPIKLPVFYFLLTASFAAWQSFYNLHLDSIGYSSMQIGALNAIFISTSAIVVPFWGMIADKYGTNRILLLLTSVAAVMVFLIGETMAFHWMVVFIAIISVFHQPAGAVLDGMTMGFVRNNPKYTFGQFRLWSSAGYAICSLVVGYFIQENTAVIFKIAALLFLLLSLINLFTLPSKPVLGRTLVNFKSFGVFFRNKNLLIFLFIIMFYGIATSPLYQFINLYYNDIGAESSFIGWVFFAQAIFEIPAFLIAAKLVKKVKPERIMIFAMIVSMLRMLLYGFISRPELAISLSIFHCVTIAFFLVGLVEYVQNRTPNHLRTTGQALIWAFHYGAGITLGNLILGYLRDTVGMLHAMHYHAALAGVMVTIALLFFRLSRDKFAKDHLQL